MIKIKKTMLFVLVVTELAVIALIGVIIINKKRLSVIRMNKENVAKSKAKALEHYYDLVPDHTEKTKYDWLEETVTNTINKDGLNESKEYQITKPNDTLRLITIGDSFTYGTYVNTTDNWTELLENKLNSSLSCSSYKKIEVINLGVNGYDIDYTIERYRRKGIKYKPDVVIWLLVDPSRILERMIPMMNKCNDRYQGSPENKAPYDICWTLSLRRVINTYGRSDINRYLANSLSQIFDIYHGNLIVADINSGHNRILDIVSPGRNLSIFNLSYKNKDFQFPDGHPNKKGHKYFADSIYNYINEKGIIPCE